MISLHTDSHCSSESTFGIKTGVSRFLHLAADGASDSTLGISTVTEKARADNVQQQQQLTTSKITLQHIVDSVMDADRSCTAYVTGMLWTTDDKAMDQKNSKRIYSMNVQYRTAGAADTCNYELSTSFSIDPVFSVTVPRIRQFE